MINLEFQIIIALLLDQAIGDPQGFPHPVRIMGWLAFRLEKITRKMFPDSERLAGIVTALLMISISGGVAWGLIAVAGYLHPLVGDVVSVIVLYYCFAARDLAVHANRVYKALKAGNIEKSRRKVAMMVGRDTAELDEQDVARAAIESVAENLVDGVTAPLFFALLFGPVGAVCFKAINTLDSTFGYKTPRYLKFGWASARIDDVANWIPARLTVLAVALASIIFELSPVRCLQIALRDRNKHSSPNSAYPEAAFAGAMGIRLGGPTAYKGKVTEYPYLGDKYVEINTTHIKTANNLMFLSTMIFALGGILIRVVI
jgi:adenosylcobinamide-phosphate synthase